MEIAITQGTIQFSFKEQYYFKERKRSDKIINIFNVIINKLEQLLSERMIKWRSEEIINVLSDVK